MAARRRVVVAALLLLAAAAAAAATRPAAELRAQRTVALVGEEREGEAVLTLLTALEFKLPWSAREWALRCGARELRACEVGSAVSRASPSRGLRSCLLWAEANEHVLAELFWRPSWLEANASASAAPWLALLLDAEDAAALPVPRLLGLCALRAAGREGELPLSLAAPVRAARWAPPIDSRAQRRLALVAEAAAFAFTDEQRNRTAPRPAAAAAARDAAPSRAEAAAAAAAAARRDSSVFDLGDTLDEAGDDLLRNSRIALLGLWSAHERVTALVEAGVESAQVFGAVIDPVLHMVPPACTAATYSAVKDPASEAIGMFLAEALIEPITQGVLKVIHPILHYGLAEYSYDRDMKTVTDAVASRVMDELPALLHSQITRITSRRLITDLTREVTHALAAQLTQSLSNDLVVPTAAMFTKFATTPLTFTVSAVVTHAMMHSPRYDVICRVECQERDEAEQCMYCQQQDDYYLDFMSAYYSHYFSKYYTNAYSNFYSYVLTNSE